MKFPYGSLAPALFFLDDRRRRVRESGRNESDWRFSVQQVTRVEVSVDWPDTALVRERSKRATLVRRRAQFEGGGLAIDDDVIARIGAGLPS